MELRNQDGEIGSLPLSSSSSSSLVYNPPPIRGTTAFAKPILPPSSSLILSSPRGGGGGGGGSANAAVLARNGGAFGSSPTTPSSVHLPSATADPGHGDSSPPISATTTLAADSGGTDVNAFRYKECLRNHAAASGGLVVDGCGEFMPSGDGGSSFSPEPLKCAACGCHRSFHRKAADPEEEDQDGDVRRRYGLHHAGAHVPLLLPPPLYRAAAGQHPLSPSGVIGSGGTTTESSSEERFKAAAAVAAAASAGAPTAVRRKRVRTKFTAEQKEKMLAFAERIGWTVQKQEEGMVERFCDDAGITRHILKVWMHNNKNANKKQPPPPPSPSPLPSQSSPPPPPPQEQDRLLHPVQPQPQ